MPILGSSASQNTKSFLQPNAPTIGTATDVGTSRAYNNGSATVTFTAAATGAAATSFTATSSTGGYTVTGASSPLTVTGLQSATAYTFVVKATNSVGDSSNSSASNSITATTVPQAPTIGTATRNSSSSVSVAFTANSNGGTAITNFVLSGGAGGSGSSSPISSNGSYTKVASYSWSVYATNANGNSPASGNSNSIVVNPYVAGDVGPGGGYISYDAGSVLSWGRYIEIAGDNQGFDQSGSGGPMWSGTNYVSGATGTAIGTGASNTALAATSAGAGTALRLPASFGAQWFLPSRDELNTFWLNRNTLNAASGQSATNSLWSSSEVSLGLATAQNFSTGATFSYNKTQGVPYRPFRYSS